MDVNEPKSDQKEFFKQTKKSLFWINLIAFGFQMFRFNFFVATFNGFIGGLAAEAYSNVTDQDIAVSEYTDYYGKIQVMDCVLLSPIVGLLMDGTQVLLRRCSPKFADNPKGLRIIRLTASAFRKRSSRDKFCLIKERPKRTWKSLFLCGSLAIFASIIQLFPNLEFQLATMIAISFYRAFLLGATAAYMNLAFPAEHFGRLYGLTRLSAALCVLFVPIFYDFVLSKGDFDISSYFFIFALSTHLPQS
jgi:MFS transporter, LAT3 family, solute carrier family 43, member 3